MTSSWRADPAESPETRRRPLASVGASLLPYGGLLTAYERLVMPLVVRRMRRNGTSLPEPVSLAEHWSTIPAVLRDAIDRRGGPTEVQRELARFTKRWNAVPLAVLTKGPARWAKLLAEQGSDELRAARATGRPVIVVMPHFGPRGFVFLHLLHLGFPVALLAHIEPESARLYTRLARLLTSFADVDRRLVIIEVPSLTAVVRADAALSGGAAVIWSPDKVEYYTRHTRVVPCEWLGRTVGLSPVVHRLVQKRGADVFLVSTRLLPGPGPALSVTYDAFPTVPGEDAGAFTRRLARASEALVLDNIDQAELWWHFPDDIVEAPTNPC